ncbi:MAG: acetyl-CoA carboxylase carboxyl transferase subunit alpha, partial [Flavobacteriaceae bacterium]|nr:acetyl-CoA carboxylase carboxyl transferase subunit alpha [Flavobacteriaceae bacterium]
EYKAQAAEALKLTAKYMKKMKLVDEIINEPLGGAHRDKDATYKAVQQAISDAFSELEKLSPEKLVEQRMNKYADMGVFKD